MKALPKCTGFESPVGLDRRSFLQRFGGGKRIEAAKPFFIGLILGHFFGILIGLIVDRIWFPIDGHSIEIAA